ncbi:dsDNA nuclease domain-containing protein [Dictyobacter aurantiacus]|uniref:NACHT domain-containing protein n=1 Tax=Dictyobacter aurantiacus TaxID=1936993 RepID=A0A401ZBN2_9CHLR|nr:dsDNA nuclease domain-containing protein [Dictyobacter aurantiacus]GCE04252.1 hypothetical protein KDAU_15810 [Dictyobacter aurantiacus]
MAKQSPQQKNQGGYQQGIFHTPSIDSVLNTTDPGDDIQRRFRYQHAYGIVLLVASINQKLPYQAIICENYEDLVGKIDSDNFDVYQIKTRQSGLWTLLDDDFKHSIKRFIELDQEFPGKINGYYFVSNIGPESSSAQRKLGRNPLKLLQAVEKATSPSLLDPPFNESFDVLCQYCQCNPQDLMSVLKKLKLVRGPGLDSFEAEIAQDHLSSLTVCQDLSALALAVLRDDLIAMIYKASSLSSNDPARHWYGLNEAENKNPQLLAKKITIENVLELIRNKYTPHSISSEHTHALNERLQEVIGLYLAASFKEDQVAKLDQAGETDSDRTTLLHQVFVDLEMKPRKDQPNPPSIALFGKRSRYKRVSLWAEAERTSERALIGREKVLSAMNSFVKEIFTQFVIIGGPGQGKSTLGQYLAQIHRAILLQREDELYQDLPGGKAAKKRLRPKTKRIPFRIVLKYFAQWLADSSEHETVEAYIAEQICKKAACPREVDEKIIHEILRTRPTLLIFDGLDEVTEQNLCDQMLSCITEFLSRAEQLRANMQVIATCRPTSYKDQFSPDNFWHMELQPMSVEKVNEYAANWINIKAALLEEEQRRIKQTLDECLNERHTRDLLTTPLQVTIILLIIKDRGRPPSQREALFEKYWTTILDREKAKAQGMILTDDLLLFSLHAYMGYLLHRNAATENTRSLLPANEFVQLVCHFLYSQNNRLSAQAIQQRAEQIVEEARTRLVLIVEPEKGFFGFEIRSLQEFFAGVHIAETAKDTNQRFARFKAIAYSQHWHNVALFVAGRIINYYRGEAANILEICRQIDREYPDTYLRRGAWLALDIVADGVFGSYRNLQLSTLEHALTVFDDDITPKNRTYLRDALQKLSLDDYREILNVLFKKNHLPILHTQLLMVIDIYGKSIGADQYFMRALEILLLSSREKVIIEALNLGFLYKVKPIWLSEQLKVHWQVWTKEIHNTFRVWWSTNAHYTQKVLQALPLSEERANELMNCLFDLGMYYYYYNSFKLEVLDDLTSFSSQINLLMQIIHLSGMISIMRQSTLSQIYTLKIDTSLKIFQVNIKQLNKEERFMKLIPPDVLSRLLSDSKLMPQLRACIWTLYCEIHILTSSEIDQFLAESDIWIANQRSFVSYFRSRSSPLLNLILERHMQQDQVGVASLKPLLNEQQELLIGQKVNKALQKDLSVLSSEEQFFSILSNDYVVDRFPELAIIAKDLGITISEIIDVYFTPSLQTSEISPVLLEQVILYIKSVQYRPQGNSFLLEYILTNFSKQLNRKTIEQGIQLLHVLIKRLPDHIESCINLFLNLLTLEAIPLTVAPAILSYIENENILRNSWSRGVSGVSMRQQRLNLLNISLEYLANLAKFVNHTDNKIQQGAIIFFAALLDLVLEFDFMDDKYNTKLVALGFDWQLCLSLIRDTNIINRRRGILLLTYSPFPITEPKYFDELCSALSKSQDAQEIGAWAIFLKNFIIKDYEKKTLLNLLEAILDAPYRYASDIRIAAKERFTRLISEVDPKIKEGVDLGLP